MVSIKLRCAVHGQPSQTGADGGADDDVMSMMMAIGS